MGFVMETAVNKEKARKESIKLRQLMDKKTWEEDSLVIQNKLINSDVYKNADEILVYAAIRGETDTEHIIKRALSDGKKVALPKSYNNGIMEFYYINSINDFVIGKYKIPEPPDTNKCSGDTGLIIVPGTAFDRDGNRCGYGAGYYDRYLSIHKNLCTAAICFSFQVYDRIEHSEHDIKQDVIFTEKEIIYVR